MRVVKRALGASPRDLSKDTRLLHRARAVHVVVPGVARDRTARADPFRAFHLEAARAEAEVQALVELDFGRNGASHVDVLSALKREGGEILWQ